MATTIQNSMTTTYNSKMVPWSVRPLVSTLKRITAGTLILTTPEGYRIQFGDGSEPQADLQLENWSALRRVFNNGDIGIGESYRAGLLKTNNLTKLLQLGLQNQELLESAIHGKTILNFAYRIRHLWRHNTRRGSARNIEAHYDLGNDFYQLWLDTSMTYSSARFSDGREGDLTQAQESKYGRMLELVGARPGESILEIGCGWGGFAEYAAHQGIKVHGVTLSRRQLAYARERISKAGLGALASFELRDYRDIKGNYDHIVSIEMLEAVGERYWHTYFGKLNTLLRKNGRVAIQTIVIDDDYFERYRKSTDFIQQYIFPGGTLPSPCGLRKITQACGFSIGQSEFFGVDYAETLRRWRRNFEDNLEAVRQLGFDNRFTRLWRFYLSYCEAGFEERRIDVVQLQLMREA